MEHISTSMPSNLPSLVCLRRCDQICAAFKVHRFVSRCKLITALCRRTSGWVGERPLPQKRGWTSGCFSIRRTNGCERMGRWRRSIRSAPFTVYNVEETVQGVYPYRDAMHGVRLGQAGAPAAVYSGAARFVCIVFLIAAIERIAWKQQTFLSNHSSAEIFPWMFVVLPMSAVGPTM